MDRPVIAVTIGDPAGIGPEIVLGALREPTLYEVCRPVVVGHAETMRRCAAALGMEDMEVVLTSQPREARGGPRSVAIVDVPAPGLDALRVGEVQAACGAAADAFLRKACDLGLAGEIDAISTAPLNKESLRAAGVPHIGHTEMLEEYLSAPNPLTLFILDQMRIFFLSRHLSLRQAIDYITEERMLSMIRRVSGAMRDFGFRGSRIAVAGLNPHASDGGLFGDEEATHIVPAIAAAKAEGIDVVGPIGADSVFHQALEGQYDCVISLYHDQGHIASKTRDFFRTVTATLGLPVLRTSVDHGTAFDIAWQGKASSVSMEAAIRAAADLLQRRERT
jgi:4-hydroxythreonine-4-phosphate dehydrogenase